jgi:hypothetical protein
MTTKGTGLGKYRKGQEHDRNGRTTRHKQETNRRGTKEDKETNRRGSERNIIISSQERGRHKIMRGTEE